MIVAGIDEAGLGPVLGPLVVSARHASMEELKGKRIAVPGRYTAPSPEELHQIAQDKELKSQVFQAVSPEREWQGAFAAPVQAPTSDVFGVQRVFNGTVQSTHQGLDFRVTTGTPVEAVNRGKVLLARPLFFEGNCVILDHGQGLLTLYLHLSEFNVKEGETVEKGQQIGMSGGTGRATGPHLHYEFRIDNVHQNPLSTALPTDMPLTKFTDPRSWAAVMRGSARSASRMAVVVIVRMYSPIEQVRSAAPGCRSRSGKGAAAR